MIEEEKQQDNLEQPQEEPSAESPQQSDATSVEEPTPATEVPEQPPVPDGELSEDEDDADDEPEETPVSAEEAAASVAAAEQAAAVEALMMSNQAYQAQIEQLKEQNEELKAQYSRLAADFENFRKRTAREKEELDLQSKCSTIGELLPAIDNFERARSQIKPQTDTEMNIHKSYQSVYKQMVDALKKIGVSPMRPEGQEFDPNLHEAVMREATDEYAEGIVVEELMRGYMLGERILRHAMVKVAVAPDPVAPSEENQPENPPTEN